MAEVGNPNIKSLKIPKLNQADLLQIFHFISTYEYVVLFLVHLIIFLSYFLLSGRWSSCRIPAMGSADMILIWHWFVSIISGNKSLVCMKPHSCLPWLQCHIKKFLPIHKRNLFSFFRMCKWINSAFYEILGILREYYRGKTVNINLKSHLNRTKQHKIYV